MKQTFSQFLEAFNDLGKLSPDELSKGQKLDQLDDDNFKEVNGRVFHQALTEIRNNDMAKMDRGVPFRGLVSLSVYGVNEYKEMDCYLGKNNSSGFAISDGDELVSVFSTAGSSAKAIMREAIDKGVSHLDCFVEIDPDTKKLYGKLYHIYSSMGFKLDKTINEGGEYPIENGISYVYDENGDPELSENDSTKHKVVIYMKL